LFIRTLFAVTKYKADKQGRRTRFAITLSMLFFVALVYLAPVFLAYGYKEGPGLVSLACRSMCHQQVSRSLFILDEVMPVCARCAGIVLGFALGSLFVNLFCQRFRHFKKLFLMGIAPMLIDGSAQALALYPSPDWLRYGTGFLFGATIIIVLMQRLISGTVIKSNVVGD
jgi:uncharacterized membrane protein